ncbi:HNH endonuclease [Nocardia abscessus]|uniref:HNH endonuclease n=1 Tax=Nocardia abscessus TaxID=120957 RepID=UPI0024537D00|nr:HNH endonuclease signature motif containing protein [Nocardia abscessus]
MNESLCRRIVTERSGRQCERCRTPGITMHHRWKRSHGGPWTPSNIVALCVACHHWVEHHPTMAHELGLWLFNGQHEPELHRVWLRDPWMLLDRWAWLDDFGDYSETPPRTAESASSL